MLPLEVLHHSVQIDKHVIICLHDKLCLLTVLPSPLDPRQGLEGEVLIGVEEVLPDDVPVTLHLLPDLLLQVLLGRRGDTQEKDYPGLVRSLTSGDNVGINSEEVIWIDTKVLDTRVENKSKF